MIVPQNLAFISIPPDAYIQEFQQGIELAVGLGDHDFAIVADDHTRPNPTSYLSKLGSLAEKAVSEHGSAVSQFRRQTRVF